MLQLMSKKNLNHYWQVLVPEVCHHAEPASIPEDPPRAWSPFAACNEEKITSRKDVPGEPREDGKIIEIALEQGEMRWLKAISREILNWHIQARKYSLLQAVFWDKLDITQFFKDVLIGFTLTTESRVQKLLNKEHCRACKPAVT
ncbi:hypothetical protein C8J56DRAFT_899249 [Mycena floridula]|nr:hypothetical protein C8J56DRAFT_899249 [Mycena floridula]